MQKNELRGFGELRIRNLDIRERAVGGGADYQNRRYWKLLSNAQDDWRSL